MAYIIVVRTCSDCPHWDGGCERENIEIMSNGECYHKNILNMEKGER